MTAVEFDSVDAATLLDNDARIADEFYDRLRTPDAAPQQL
jgi:hypothetical protein